MFLSLSLSLSQAKYLASFSHNITMLFLAQFFLIARLMLYHEFKVGEDPVLARHPHAC
jgi:hypothetical protein